MDYREQYMQGTSGSENLNYNFSRCSNTSNSGNYETCGSYTEPRSYEV
jgi:hypothetical protein